VVDLTMLLRTLTQVYILLSVAVTLAVAGQDTPVELQDCVSFGFDPEKLSCGTCVRLAQTLDEVLSSGNNDLAQIDAVIDMCEQCCQELQGNEEALDSGEDVASAELVIDRFRIAAFPSVSEFVDSRSTRFGKALSITDRFTRGPVLILRNEDGDAVRRIEVGRWNAEEIEDFLAHKINI